MQQLVGVRIAATATRASFLLLGGVVMLAKRCTRHWVNSSVPFLFEYRISVVLLAGIACMMLATNAVADSEMVEFDIPSQPVSSALRSYAQQAGVQIAASTQGFEKIQANAVVGRFDPQTALHMLIAGTGLQAEFQSNTIITVQRSSETSVREVGSAQDDTLPFLLAQANVESNRQLVDVGASQATQNSTLEEPEDSDVELEEIVVTGTSIRGFIPESSPLEIYNAVDIRNTGALTVEQFVSRLPQNNNTLSEAGGGTSAREPGSINTVDLRGLGVGSTLVLLNGRRMAPSSAGRTADLSFIPLGAVERVEVLTDGASAIYGADAISGVVNFVLRDQEEGANTVFTFGGAESDPKQVRIDQSFGFNWEDGNSLIALSYFDRSDLDAADRDFSRPAAPFTIIPDHTRKNALATVSQELPGDFSVSADFLYSTISSHTARNSIQFGAPGTLDFRETETDHKQTVVNVEVERSLGDSITAALLVTNAEFSRDANSLLNGPNIGVGPTSSIQDTKFFDVTAKIDGELITLPGGAVRFALGIGYNEDEYDSSNDQSEVNGFTSTLSLERETEYAFAELQVPIVKPEQSVPGIRRLEFSLAARYTDYSDFGEDTSPKFGLLWSPVKPLKIRGTYGESFKAPFLPQTDPTGGNNALFPIAALGTPDIWTPDNSAVMLFVSGPGNPSLGPERSENLTLGVDLDFSGVSLSATYFDISYTDRIAEPDSQGGSVALVDPANFPEFFEVNPTLEEITAALANSENFFNATSIDIDDPAAVWAATTVYFDNRIRNLSETEIDGFDISFDYTTELNNGDASFGAAATKMLSFEEKVFASAPPTTKLDVVLYPADLKIRSYVGVNKDRWSARLNLNYIDDYDNPFDPADPTIDEWYTVDVVVSYEFPTEGSGFLSGLRLGLTVQNMFDEDPPFVSVGTTSDISLTNPTGYDPSNASPLGRFIDFQISKRW